MSVITTFGPLSGDIRDTKDSLDRRDRRDIRDTRDVRDIKGIQGIATKNNDNFTVLSSTVVFTNRLRLSVRAPSSKHSSNGLTVLRPVMCNSLHGNSGRQVIPSPHHAVVVWCNRRRISSSFPPEKVITRDGSYHSSELWSIHSW